MAQDIQVAVPDIGDFESVDVIDVLVKPGDLINPEDPLITLESDKATMDVPAPVAGRVVAIEVRVGDKVSQGRLILTVAPAAGGEAPVAPKVAEKPPETAPVPAATPATIAPPPTPAPANPDYGFASPDPGPRTLEPPAASHALLHGENRVHASPALRKFARELGVDLHQVKGSGPKGRIVRPDVTGFVKETLEGGGSGSGFALPKAPLVDFSRFGPVETIPLGKIRRATGQNLHRAWISIPHVTQFDEADITELEAFRRARAPEADALGGKLTLVVFVLKALAAGLHRFPDFNSSLALDGASLVRKGYFHVGVAVNTPRGLVVPVVRDVERKPLFALAKELRELSQRARDGKLAPADMQGACITVTSLGGVGGTAFTPIINPPEVAILGLSPAAMKPQWRDDAFVPRLMLPLSLSYDHRVIDGVAAAEFTRFLSRTLQDIRELLL